jgi:hypothetical protein
VQSGKVEVEMWTVSSHVGAFPNNLALVGPVRGTTPPTRLQSPKRNNDTPKCDALRALAVGFGSAFLRFLAGAARGGFGFLFSPPRAGSSYSSSSERSSSSSPGP